MKPSEKGRNGEKVTHVSEWFDVRRWEDLELERHDLAHPVKQHPKTEGIREHGVNYPNSSRTFGLLNNCRRRCNPRNVAFDDVFRHVLSFLAPSLTCLPTSPAPCGAHALAVPLPAPRPGHRPAPFPDCGVPANTRGVVHPFLG